MFMFVLTFREVLIKFVDENVLVPFMKIEPDFSV